MACHPWHPSAGFLTRFVSEVIRFSHRGSLSLALGVKVSAWRMRDERGAGGSVEGGATLVRYRARITSLTLRVLMEWRPIACRAALRDGPTMRQRSPPILLIRAGEGLARRGAKQRCFHRSRVAGPFAPDIAVPQKSCVALRVFRVAVLDV